MERLSRTPHGVRGLKSRAIRAEEVLAESHPARGAWIEIPLMIIIYTILTRRTPHGVRGLKLAMLTPERPNEESHPARGAWIEIAVATLADATTSSHPARGAWIEIKLANAAKGFGKVAPRTGCVD